MPTGRDPRVLLPRATRLAGHRAKEPRRRGTRSHDGGGIAAYSDGKIVPASRSGSGQRVAMTLRAPAASHARVMPMSPAPGRTRAAAGAAPIQHDQSDFGRKAGCLDVAQQVDPASRLQAESKHSPALLVAREEHMRRDVEHRWLRSERFRERLPGCRHSLQQRGWQPVSAPNAGACLDFPGASRQTGQFHAAAIVRRVNGLKKGAFGFAALDRPAADRRGYKSGLPRPTNFSCAMCGARRARAGTPVVIRNECCSIRYCGRPDRPASSSTRAEKGASNKGPSAATVQVVAQATQDSLARIVPGRVAARGQARPPARFRRAATNDATSLVSRSSDGSDTISKPRRVTTHSQDSAWPV